MTDVKSGIIESYGRGSARAKVYILLPFSANFNSAFEPKPAGVILSMLAPVGSKNLPHPLN